MELAVVNQASPDPQLGRRTSTDRYYCDTAPAQSNRRQYTAE